MSVIIYKALTFVAIIALGYILQRTRFFGPGASAVITKLVFTFTLPAAIISSFEGFERDPSLFVIAAMGLGANVFMFLLGMLLSRRKSAAQRSFLLMNLPGYNIGAFTLPFVQNFFGSTGVIAACLFDMGNAVMCTGGGYALATGVLGVVPGEKPSVKTALKRLFSSVPFDTYMIMFAVALCGIQLPQGIFDFTASIGGANSFMAMLMIGSLLRLEMKLSYLKEVGKILLLRYLLAAALALVCYYLLPFSLEIRQVLAVVVFAPHSSLSPAFTEKCKGDPGLASFSNSISILLSLVIMTAMITVMVG